jgi:hypothetical protein
MKTVRLGGSKVGISYPPALDPWFDGLIEAGDESSAPEKWMRLCAGRDPDRFDVLTSANPASCGLSLGEALASGWRDLLRYQISLGNGGGASR